MSDHELTEKGVKMTSKDVTSCRGVLEFLEEEGELIFTEIPPEDTPEGDPESDPVSEPA